MKNIAPGVYKDISNEDYHAGPGISKSGISLVLDSPLKFKMRYIDGEVQEPTKQMVIGSATHMAVFEPDLFDTAYVVAPEINKRTKAGKAELLAFRKENEGKTVISSDDAEMIFSLRDTVRNHPRAGSIVKAAGGLAEHSIFADHPGTGLLTKVRPDWLVADFGMLVDLKTTVDASPTAFSRACFNFTYHIQAGMYLSVAQEQGFTVDSFIFIAVEKTPPFSVAVYFADMDMISLGMQEFERGMEVYARCLEAEQWPGYNDDDITTISLPFWAVKQLEGVQNV